MTFFKSLVGTLISESTRRSSKSKSFFTLCSTAQQPFLNSNPGGAATSAASSSLNTPFLSHNHRILNFRRRGPLFLSFPPWKLSQSATPLLLQGDLGLLNLPPKLNTALDFRYKFWFKHSPKKLLEGNSDGNKESVDGEVSSSKLAVATSEGNAAVRITDSYVNLPNFISLGRLLSGPLLGWMITQEMYVPAFIGLALSGASDWLDGYVARKMGINSVVGSYLDPLADKVLIAFVAMAMVERGLLHPGLVGLVVLRDVALIGGAVYKRASSLEWKWKSWFDFFNLDGTRPERVEPLFLSKVNTFFQLVLVAAALLQPGFGNEETEVFITYLSWLVALTTVGSTVAYGRQHLKKTPQLLKN